MNVSRGAVGFLAAALLIAACEDDSGGTVQPPAPLPGARLSVNRVLGFGEQPNKLALNPAGDLVFVGDLSSPFVSVLEVGTDRLGSLLIDETARTLGLAVTSERLFVAGVDGAQVFVYNLRTGLRDREPLLVGPGTNLVEITSDGRYLVATSFEPPGLFVVFDGAFDFNEFQTVVLGDRPAGLALTRQRQPPRAYVMGLDRSKLFEIEFDIAARVSDSLVVDPGTSFIALAPDESRLYASNARDAVLVINLVGFVVEQRISVGQDPLGLDVSPDGRYVVAANASGGSVSLIDTFRGIALDEVSVGLGPTDVLFVGPRTAYVALQGPPAGVAVVTIIEE